MLQIDNQAIAQSFKPRHILEEIVRYKQQEVSKRRELLPFPNLLNQIATAPSVRDFLFALQNNSKKPSLIAEVKKASPSKGVICADFDPVKIAQAYERGGASCLSVLTDEKFFQGSFRNLQVIRQKVTLPLLCKEFIIDAYQIYLARVSGADAILLIAAILSDDTLQEFINLARYLGMSVLIEVHTLTELDRVLALSNVQLVGINNRNLEDFTVDLEITQHLLAQRGEKLDSMDITVVSESGLYTSADLDLVAQAGAKAVLVGESLVKQKNLEQAVKVLLNL
ncbi:indole-3-glycerol phosphate synthase [Scytonema hofmannii PCC 7110]|uniref:Indole-3-glycerol phosphate synthase n=1 Tax=Scytonema hofmannii PCC 7110 TaxID=128403 RepID=A0A139X061_9CYAN|nr:indole-3-glycerol phosphate synthase TrpC [Scytonema hofmannii]KYC38046.1 indole-3-glycerol phosphate synthase [Scytonema hofmannii PCC 7110]